MVALTVKPELCTGCMACVYACSLVHEDVFSCALARIRIEKDEALGFNVPVGCITCEGMPCVDACPVGAITVDPDTKRPVVDALTCIGCGICASTCPVGAIKIPKGSDVAIVCDMCSGEPQCVRVCIPGALSLSNGAQTDAAVSGRDRRDAALRQIGRLV